MREFVCIKCGHTVVVNPKLPADYTPTICTPCYDADAPGRLAGQLQLMSALKEFSDWLVGDRADVGPNMKALERKYNDRLVKPE